MKFKPVGNRVIVQLVEDMSQVGSIIVVNDEKKAPVTGKVVAISPEFEVVNQAVDLIKIGDVIKFWIGHGTVLNSRDKDTVLVDKENILAVVEQ